MEARETHDAVLGRIADEYRRNGYAVLPEPPAEALPEPLRGHRPDLVVTRGDDRIVVEAVGAGQGQERRVKAMAEAVRALPGWQFRLIVVPKGDLREQGVASEKSLEEIEATMREAERLTHDTPEAALLLTWAGVEAALRSIAHRSGLADLPQTANALLGRLAYEGVLSSDEYDALRNIGLVRNSVAHGYRTAIDPQQLRTVLALARGLLSEPDTSPDALAGR